MSTSVSRPTAFASTSNRGEAPPLSFDLLLAELRQLRQAPELELMHKWLADVHVTEDDLRPYWASSPELTRVIACCATSSQSYWCSAGVRASARLYTTTTALTALCASARA